MYNSFTVYINKENVNRRQTSFTFPFNPNTYKKAFVGITTYIFMVSQSIPKSKKLTIQ